MSVQLIKFWSYVNESERIASQTLIACLEPLPAHYYVFTNLEFSDGNRALSMEIDLLLIGPSGIHVIEVKDWDRHKIASDFPEVTKHAALVNKKAKRVAGKLKHMCDFDLPFVRASLLFTKAPDEIYSMGSTNMVVDGVPIFGLQECAELAQVVSHNVLSADQAASAYRTLEPPYIPPPDYLSFGDYVDLQEAGGSGSFHKVFLGRYRTDKSAVVLHVYDLAATTEPEALNTAKREFEVMKQFQKSPFVPSMVDGFQQSPRHDGDVWFFSHKDPQAPTLAEWSELSGITFRSRLNVTERCLEALQCFHSGEPVLHRCISPSSIRVGTDEIPIFTTFHASRLPGSRTLSSKAMNELVTETEFQAPETTSLSTCTTASDVYSLCGSLLTIFQRPDLSKQSEDVVKILQTGTSMNPSQRPAAVTLYQQLQSLTSGGDGPSDPKPTPGRVPQYHDSVAVMLKELVSTLSPGGPIDSKSSKRVKAALLDSCPEHKLEVNALLNALNIDMPSRLRDLVSSGIPADKAFMQSARELQEDTGIEKRLARWAARAWAVAIGIVDNLPILINPDGSGDYTSITAALRSVAPYSILELLPGVYKESIVIRKPVEIVGISSESSAPTIQHTGLCIDIRSDDVTIRDISVKQNRIGGGAVEIHGSRNSISGCQVTSSGHGIVVHEGSVHLINNTISDCQESGIMMLSDSGGEISCNAIQACHSAGILLKDQSCPVISLNKIERNALGIKTCGHSKALLKNNKICDNELSGIHITESAASQIVCNTITGNGGPGVHIESGSPSLVRNDLRDNRRGPYSVSPGLIVHVESNRE